jgi:hypothetical protein
MMYVATAISFVNSLVLIPALYGIFVAPAIYLWYNYKKKEGLLPIKGFKIRPPEQVLAEYIELSTKSGERSKKQTATS